MFSVFAYLGHRDIIKTRGLTPCGLLTAIEAAHANCRHIVRTAKANSKAHRKLVKKTTKCDRKQNINLENKETNVLDQYGLGRCYCLSCRLTNSVASDVERPELELVSV